MALQAPSADSLRAVVSNVFESPKYDWTAESHPLQFLVDLHRRIITSLDSLQHQHPAAYWVLLVVLLAILVAILTHFGYVMWHAFRAPRLPGTVAVAAPVSRRDSAWFRREAKRLAATGRFPEAMACRFRALVLDLDRGHALTFHPSKTPAEYVDELHASEATRTWFAQLVRTLYHHIFGRAPLTAAEVAHFDHEASALVAEHAAH